ncbi:hypothetical protein V1477_006338 [Vespula maculifrons]|uniref:Uncharacterized protein n=1 Tax=Vespula maculifrons TaxID=7453 RepID=A0ABD2CK56_VESMC
MVVEGATSPLNDPGPVLLVPFKQLLLGSYWSDMYAKNMGVEDATSSFKRPQTGSPRYYSFGEKNFITRLLLVRSRARRVLSNDQGPALLGAVVSEKKIVKEKCFFPLFSLNCYSSAPIGPIWPKKMWASLETVITRLLLVRSVRKKYGRRGHDEPFKRHRSGSPRCYSFGEKNS